MFGLLERFINPQGSRTVTYYLLDLKIVVDELALHNLPMDNDDLTSYIVNGLFPTLKDISVAVRTSNDYHF